MQDREIMGEDELDSILDSIDNAEETADLIAASRDFDNIVPSLDDRQILRMLSELDINILAAVFSDLDDSTRQKITNLITEAAVKKLEDKISKLGAQSDEAIILARGEVVTIINRHLAEGEPLVTVFMTTNKPELVPAKAALEAAGIEIFELSNPLNQHKLLVDDADLEKATEIVENLD